MIPGLCRLRHTCARRAVAVAALSLALPVAAWSQQPAAATARPEDVASIDAIIAAVYDVISGPAGQKRDWQRFESLFAPGARLIPTAPAPDGSVRPLMMAPSEYAETMGGTLEARGFFETEIHRVTESFGRIAHAFSTYESRWTPDAEPFQRGINSFQLLNDGERWWVVSIFWDGERPDNPIPERYRGGKN